MFDKSTHLEFVGQEHINFDEEAAQELTNLFGERLGYLEKGNWGIYLEEAAGYGVSKQVCFLRVKIGPNISGIRKYDIIRFFWETEGKITTNSISWEHTASNQSNRFPCTIPLEEMEEMIKFVKGLN